MINNICAALYERTQPSTLWFTGTWTHAQHALHTCIHAHTCMSLTVGLNTGYHVILLELNKCITQNILQVMHVYNYIVKVRCSKWRKAVRVTYSPTQLSSRYICNRVWECSVSVRSTSLWQNLSDVTDSLWSSYSTPGERWSIFLPWKWLYHCSAWNIKQCLVCCLLKSRTNGMEAKQHQGCTVRHKTHTKKLYLEWNSIFLTPKCVPSSPPTLSWAPSSSRQAL